LPRPDDPPPPASTRKRQRIRASAFGSARRSLPAPSNGHFPDGRDESPFQTVHSPPDSDLASEFWLFETRFGSEACRRGAPRLLLPLAGGRRAYPGRTSALQLGEAGGLLGSTSHNARWAEPGDPIGEAPEQLAGHRHLGHLEDEVAPVRDDLRADLHHLLPQARPPTGSSATTAPPRRICVGRRVGAARASMWTPGPAGVKRGMGEPGLRLGHAAEDEPTAELPPHTIERVTAGCGWHATRLVSSLYFLVKSPPPMRYARRHCSARAGLTTGGRDDKEPVDCPRDHPGPAVRRHGTGRADLLRCRRWGRVAAPWADVGLGAAGQAGTAAVWPPPPE
jgi:hypothetical protein